MYTDLELSKTKAEPRRLEEIHISWFKTQPNPISPNLLLTFIYNPAGETSPLRSP